MNVAAPNGYGFDEQHRLAPTVTPEDRDADEPMDLLGRVVFPRGFVVAGRRLTPHVQRSRTLDVLAARIVFGSVSESLTKFAERHGVLKQSLAERVARMEKKLGICLHRLSDKHRAALSRAAFARWRKRKAAEARTSAATNQEAPR